MAKNGLEKREKLVFLNFREDKPGLFYLQQKKKRKEKKKRKKNLLVWRSQKQRMHSCTLPSCIFQ
jgi:hypothetical protein